MGCDIHMVLEQKNEHTDEWVGINDLPYIERHRWTIRERNYKFFAALAGVRGDGPEPLGAPPDASALTRLRLQSWSSDAHSTSYLSAREFLKRFCDDLLRNGEQSVAAQEIKNMLGDSWYENTLDKYFNTDIHDKQTQLRVVFWFDN